MLDALGIWPTMVASGVSPIHSIRVSDGRFGRATWLRREEIEVEALGHIVPNVTTQSALLQFLAGCSNVQLYMPARLQSLSREDDCVRVAVDHKDESLTLRAKLLVAADGARSRLREQAGIPVSRWDYSQACIVTTATTECPHQQVAYERFQPSGPFAILPMHADNGEAESHRSCVVWTVRLTDRDRLMDLNDADFIAAIAPWFGAHSGDITSVSPRLSYVPQRSHSLTYVQPRFALVGDAAHSTHPVGGQGVNLGMRDVAALAEVLMQARSQGQDVGSLAVLERYHRWRRGDNAAVLFATDAANRAFSNQIWPLQWARRLGLLGIDTLPPLKHWLMRRAMGLSGQLPQLMGGKRSFSPAGVTRSGASGDRQAGFEVTRATR
jgi:2-octaprenyl-6-methoxyphenol hydroxylase